MSLWQGFLFIWDNMGGRWSVVLSERSWTKKSTVRFHLYVESKNQNKQHRNKLIDTENTLVVSRWEGRGAGRKGWREEEEQADRYSHADVKSVNGVITLSGVRWVLD